MKKIRGALLIAVALGCAGCATKKQAQPITFVLRSCHIVEETNVENASTGEQHTELICDCSVRSEKRDAKTGKIIVECR